MNSDQAAEALFAVFTSSATPATLKIDAVRALSWIDTMTALEYLGAGLQGSEAEQEIIVLLGRKTLPALKAKATQILIDFFSNGQSPQLKQALATSLGELGEPQAIDTLLELSEDAQQSVRLHARAALNKFAVHQS